MSQSVSRVDRHFSFLQNVTGLTLRRHEIDAVPATAFRFIVYGEPKDSRVRVEMRKELLPPVLEVVSVVRDAKEID